MKHQLKSTNIHKETKLHFVHCISIDTVLCVGEFSIFREFDMCKVQLNFEEKFQFQKLRVILYLTGQFQKKAVKS